MMKQWKLFYLVSLMLIGCSVEAVPLTYISAPANVGHYVNPPNFTYIEGHESIIYNDTGHAITISAHSDYVNHGTMLGYNTTFPYADPQIPLGNPATQCVTPDSAGTLVYAAGYTNNIPVMHSITWASPLPPCTLNDQQYIEVDTVVPFPGYGNDAEVSAHITGLNGAILIPNVSPNAGFAPQAFPGIYNPLFASNQYPGVPATYPNLAYMPFSTGSRCDNGEFFMSAYTPPPNITGASYPSCPAGFVALGGPTATNDGNSTGGLPVPGLTGNLCVRFVSASYVSECAMNMDIWEVIVTGDSITSYRNLP